MLKRRFYQTLLEWKTSPRRSAMHPKIPKLFYLHIEARLNER